MLKIGVTGTRYGTNETTLNKFLELFTSLENDIIELHHGDCVGVDKQIHDLLNNVCRVIIHPPSNRTHRAMCTPRDGEIMKEREYLKRNKDIVSISDIIFAFPSSNEILHSGTWATIRLAKKLNKQLVILYACGTVESFNI